MVNFTTRMSLSNADVSAKVGHFSPICFCLYDFAENALENLHLCVDTSGTKSSVHYAGIFLIQIRRSFLLAYWSCLDLAVEFS